MFYNNIYWVFFTSFEIHFSFSFYKFLWFQYIGVFLIEVVKVWPCQGEQIVTGQNNVAQGVYPSFQMSEIWDRSHDPTPCKIQADPNQFLAARFK